VFGRKLLAFADRTTVPVDQTLLEIQKTVARYGAEQFVYAVMENRIVVGFTKEARQVRFQAPQDVGDAQASRQRARALLLVLKAKLEAVASGVAIFEDEFLANIVLPDGKLVGQHVRARIAQAYETRETPPLLPDYSA
jgi:hypothetical protein